MDMLEPLVGLLQKADVKRVSFRYKGREGRGLVYQVNFFHRDNRFMTYDEIGRSGIPENELFEIAEQLLSTKLPTWANDWGSSGEITWELGHMAAIQHVDRIVHQREQSVSISSRELEGLTGPIEPLKEMGQVTAIRSTFAHNEDLDTWIFDDYLCEHPNGTFSASKGLAQITSSVFTAVLKRVTSQPQGWQQGIPVSGLCIWVPGERVLLDVVMQVEQHKPASYHVPVAG
jgi:hypothetical protein